MARKKIIAGNWKMNKTPSEAVALVKELAPLVANDEADVVFCVPAIDIIPAMEAAKGTNIQIGAENMYYEESGAYTGEISPAMLTDAGVKYVIIGHSERREYFAETDETVNKKVLKAFEHSITPIVCCAEEVCAAIRNCIKEVYDDATAEAIRIQYGGSVNAGNAAELFSKPDIDGGLVGGASLKPDFGKIVNYK